MPEFLVLGGPNGVGKSTIADAFYSLREFEMINGDRILQQLSLSQNINQDLTSLARDEINKKVKNSFKNKKSLLIESNLNIPSSYKLVDIARENGYETRLKYFGVDDLDVLNKRIAIRALLGLHYISPDHVKQKYQSRH